VQEAEETFDLALVAALEIDVVPYLGDARVPGAIVELLASVLQRGSRVRDEGDYRPPSPRSPGGSQRASHDFGRIEKIGHVPAVEGSTESGRFVPRERFSFWCFDLLFVVCSDTAKGGAFRSFGRRVLTRGSRQAGGSQAGGCSGVAGAP
jgi:hypothetical protein